jgi:hypothetical protein
LGYKHEFQLHRQRAQVGHHHVQLYLHGETELVGTSEANPSRKIAEEARRFYNAGDERRWGRDSIPGLKGQVDGCLRLSMVHRDAVVAELGSGRGAFRYLAELYHYVALDISFEALNRFTGPPHAIQAEIEKLPLTSQSVDFVLSAATLEHVPHPESLIRDSNE